MPLLPIKVIVPVSVCAPSVRVQGQLAGSTVVVFADGSPVGETVAGSADILVPITGSVSSGQNITATQSLNGETSPVSPIPVAVQGPPPALPFLSAGFLQECSECLVVLGTLPGARAVVRSGQTLRGESSDAALTLHVPISPAAGPSEVLATRQETSACGFSEDVLLQPGGLVPQTLPSPRIERPLKECQAAITISGVSPGAVVTVERSAGPDRTGCIGSDRGVFGLPPLQGGESLRVRQSFPACDRIGPLSDPFVVDPVEPVRRPVISGTYDSCVGTTSILLTNLIPTAQVEFLQDDVSLGLGQVPPGSTIFAFPVSAVPDGSTIVARQALCDRFSDASDPIVVNRRDVAVPDPIVVSPLNACGAVVRVENLVLGYHSVTVHSGLLGAPIGHGDFWTTTGFVDVPVVPTLIEGDAISASIKGCGGETERSAPVNVGPQPAVEPPRIPEDALLEDGATLVPLEAVIPGAFVEVFASPAVGGGDTLLVGSGSFGATIANVVLSTPLSVGHLVRARQRICARTSQAGPTVQVIHKIPVAAFTLVPASGRAPLTVAFQNESLYANHPTQPFRWEFVHAGDGSGPTSVEVNPSHTYDEPGEYIALLSARNASEHQNFTTRAITVLEPLPDEESEDAITVHLTPDPSPSGGNTLYVGQVGHRPGQHLVRIENWQLGFPLSFPKQGESASSCSDPDGSIEVLQGSTLSGADLEAIYGDPTPATDAVSGLSFRACRILDGQSDPDVIWITAVFEDE